MSEYKKLKDEFERKVQGLQDSCSHEELSVPQEVYWAIGHSCGYRSRFCLRCGKQMYKPTFDFELKGGEEEE